MKNLFIGLVSLFAAGAAHAETSCNASEGTDTVLVCSKTTAAGNEWTITFVDKNSTGTFRVCARRDDAVLYDDQSGPEYFLSMTKLPVQGHGLSLVSPGGTVRFTLNGTVGRFETERYGYDVQNLSCFFAL